MHLIANCAIDLRGDQTLSETYVIGFHFLKSARLIDSFLGDGALLPVFMQQVPEALRDEPHEYTAGARYLDRFERRNGEWRISHRHLVFDWSQTRPALMLFDRSTAASTLSRGKNNPTDSSYELFGGRSAWTRAPQGRGD